MTQKRQGRKQVLTSVPITTSKGRSPLDIALLHQKTNIVHFLVAEMGQSLFDEENLSTDVALANFTSLLRMIPSDFFFEGRQLQTTSVPVAAPALSNSMPMKANRRPSM
jgi:hypothetical protein